VPLSHPAKLLRFCTFHSRPGGIFVFSDWTTLTPPPLNPPLSEGTTSFSSLFEKHLWTGPFDEVTIPLLPLAMADEFFSLFLRCPPPTSFEPRALHIPFLFLIRSLIEASFEREVSSALRESFSLPSLFFALAPDGRRQSFSVSSGSLGDF